MENNKFKVVKYSEYINEYYKFNKYINMNKNIDNTDEKEIELEVFFNKEKLTIKDLKNIDVYLYSDETETPYKIIIPNIISNNILPNQVYIYNEYDDNESAIPCPISDLYVIV